MRRPLRDEVDTGSGSDRVTVLTISTVAWLESRSLPLPLLTRSSASILVSWPDYRSLTSTSVITQDLRHYRSPHPIALGQIGVIAIGRIAMADHDPHPVQEQDRDRHTIHLRDEADRDEAERNPGTGTCQISEACRLLDAPDHAFGRARSRTPTASCRHRGPRCA